MKLLAQFKTIHSYVDFCLPELKSLIVMHGLDWHSVFQHEFEGEEVLENEVLLDKFDNINLTKQATSQVGLVIDIDSEIPRKKQPDTHDFTASDMRYVYLARKLAGKGVKKDRMPDDPSDITHTSFVRFPFVFLEFPCEEVARSIVSRSMLLDVCIQVISESGNYEELIERVDHAVFALHNQPDEKIIFEVDSFNSHLTRPEVIWRINLITDRLGMWGKIDLKTPSKRFLVLERHIDSYTKHTDNTINSTLLDIFFGIEIGRSKASSRSSQKENFFLRYDLKNRVYLGPTSTDNLLSFLMSNQGLSQAGSLVLDPFVGTGSLLVPASHFGSFCFGSDLDPRVLHGFGVGRVNNKSDFFSSNSNFCTEMEPKIMLNFEQYALDKPTIIHMDCMNTNFKDNEIFDAIICDPPYGIRAMTRTSNKNGKKKRRKAKKKVVQASDLKELSTNANTDSNKNKEIQDITEGRDEEEEEEEKGHQPTSSHNHQHHSDDEYMEDEQVPSTAESRSINTTVSELEEMDSVDNHAKALGPGSFCPTETISVDQIVRGLFSLANKILVPSGRLVFLYPIERKNFNKRELADNLLDFPNFTVLDIAENTLNEKKGRVLITMQKNLSNKLPTTQPIQTLTENALTQAV